jgi:hypothetical protein
MNVRLWRSQTKMPDDYLPEAPGVLIAGEEMLRAAGHVPASHRPAGWTPGESGTFMRRRRRDGDHTLWVRKCGKLWLIERSLDLDSGLRREIEALVFAFGPRPICTRTYVAAMRLAEHCDPSPGASVARYWAKVCVVRMMDDGLMYITR